MSRIRALTVLGSFLTFSFEYATTHDHENCHGNVNPFCLVCEVETNDENDELEGKNGHHTNSNHSLSNFGNTILAGLNLFITKKNIAPTHSRAPPVTTSQTNI